MSIASTLTSLFGQHAPDKDQAVLDQLKKAGSDLSKPHKIEFFLYYSSEDVAKQATREIEKEGIAVSVQKSSTGEAWLCLGAKTMIPTIREMARLRKTFDEISKRFNGEYDGWGTEVVAAEQKAIWPSLPTTGFITGRAAKEQDVKDGNAVFVAARDGKVIGKPIPIEIPQFAYWNDEESGKRVRVIIIQAERADDQELIGFKIIESGEYGAALKMEFNFLGVKP